MRPSSWIPPLVWMAVIMLLSSGSFSSQRTGGVLLGLVAGLAPWLTPADVAALHGAVRKATHFVEYAILAVLWFRTLIHVRALPTWAAAVGALAICVLWAALDETHQRFVPSRTGSVEDVAIDAAGSLAALAIARRTWLSTASALTALLLWLAAVGGAVVLAINQVTGVPSGHLWVTVPAAAAVLAGRWWWARPKS
ncbi:MAG: VanZ family protein [Candidatus Rokuibacteriota bacterium]